MKHIVTVLIFAGMSAALSAQENVADKYPGYRLEFADEFDTGVTPDPDKWEFETGMRRNHEDQVYTTDNATISDGMLVIEARKEKVKNPDYKRYSIDWNKKKQ